MGQNQRDLPQVIPKRTNNNKTMKAIESIIKHAGISLYLVVALLALYMFTEIHFFAALMVYGIPTYWLITLLIWSVKGYKDYD